MDILSCTSCSTLTLEDFRRVWDQLPDEPRAGTPIELLPPFPLSHETLAKLEKPMDLSTYLRWRYPVEIQRPTIGMYPLLAEGSGGRKRERPWSWARIARAHKREVKARARARRRYKQQRAAFRRWKRGLA